MNPKLAKKNGHARLTDRIPKNAPRNLFKNVAISFLLTMGITLLCILLLSAAFYATADPNRYIAPLSMSLLFISSLLGGFLAVKRHNGSALLCGLLFAVMMLALTLSVSLFFDLSLSADRSLPMEFGLRGIAAALSILGAFIGATEKKKKPRKRKH